MGTFTIDMSGCECCEGECCCEVHPECLTVSIVGEGGCSCWDADLDFIVTSVNPLPNMSISYEPDTGNPYRESEDCEFSRIGDILNAVFTITFPPLSAQCNGYRMQLDTTLAQVNASGCHQSCNPFFVEFDLQFVGEPNEFNCDDVIHVTITERACP